MNLEWHISNRYLKSKKHSGTSLIAKVAVLGLILAVMVLITVLSVMNGFHKELKNRILSAISHGYIASYDDFDNYESLQLKINNSPEVIASSLYVEKYGLINFKGSSAGINVRGIKIEQEIKTSSLLKKVKGSVIFKNNNDIIVGLGVATQLNANIGDKVTIITPQISNNVFNTTPRFKRFIISGIFTSGSEYDDNLVFVKLSQAQKLYKLKNTISGIRLKVKNILEADKNIKDLIKTLDENKYYGVDWKQQKRNFIAALNLEKQMIAMILSLIIAVAVFNIISMMIMVIKDKKTDIAILRTFGFTGKQIMLTFLYLGIKIGTLGIIIGTILGLLLSNYINEVISFIEIIFNTKFFPEDIFYINNFPSEIQFNDVIFVISISFILIILSSIYPAKNASKINISQTLKEL